MNLRKNYPHYSKQQICSFFLLGIFAFSFFIQQVNFYNEPAYKVDATANERSGNGELERESQDLPLLLVNLAPIASNSINYYYKVQKNLNTTDYVAHFIRPFLRAPPAI